jgi:hypothetical protein
MQFSNFNSEYYYWKKQLDIMYSQYCNLSGENKQCWLDNKKRMLDSKLKYVEQRKLKAKKRNPIRISSPTSTLLTLHK